MSIESLPSKLTLPMRGGMKDESAHVKFLSEFVSINSRWTVKLIDSMAIACGSNHLFSMHLGWKTCMSSQEWRNEVTPTTDCQENSRYVVKVSSSFILRILSTQNQNSVIEQGWAAPTSLRLQTSAQYTDLYFVLLPLSAEFKTQRDRENQ